MKLSILFRFHQNIPLCKNRLQMLRHYNPGIGIYGLYGGSQEQSSIFERELSPLLDDFFCPPVDKDPKWKWHNGDLLINEWFLCRGQFLDWDTIVSVHWDMIILGSISDIFSELKENQILLGGVRPIEEISSHWFWVRKDQPSNYAKFNFFKQSLLTHHDYNGPFLACHLIVACLPRNFLELYSKIEMPDGRDEYRLPTYAKVFGIPFSTESNKFQSWWYSAPGARKIPWKKRVLVPTGPILSHSLVFILYQFYRNGSRIFHPFVYIFPNKPSDFFSFIFDRQRLSNLKKKLAMNWKRINNKLKIILGCLTKRST